MKQHFGFFLGQVFDIQAFRPLTAIGLVGHHHIVLFLKALDDQHVSRHQMPFLYTFDAQRLHMLQRFYVLLDLARDVTTAIHMAFIQHVQKSLIDLDLFPEQGHRQGVAYIVLASCCKGVKVISGCRWTAFIEIEVLYIAPRDIFAV